MSAEPSRVAVFGPHPLLSITVERRGSDGDDVHVHSGGQGVWVARMAGELGAHPILCSFCGGETGRLLEPLLEEMSGEVRLVRTTATSGTYVIDRRSGERDMIAQHWSDPPSRHEADDLFSITCAAALESEVLVVCGTVPKDALPLETFGNLVANARANGTQVVVDLSPPNLNSALEGRPSVVKLDDWQLGEYAQDDMTDPEKLRAAARRVLEAGAEAVLVTRGGDPALVLRGDGRLGAAGAEVRRRLDRGLRRLDGGCARRRRSRAASRWRRRCAGEPRRAPRTSCAMASGRARATSSRTSTSASSFSVSESGRRERRRDRLAGEDRARPLARDPVQVRLQQLDARKPSEAGRKLDRAPAVRGVSVGAEQVQQPAPRQLQQRGGGRPLGDQRSRRLDQRVPFAPGRRPGRRSHRPRGAPGAR